jgi:hypothetical protein
MSALGRFKADVCGILAVFLPDERLEVEAWLFVAGSGMSWRVGDNEMCARKFVHEEWSSRIGGFLRAVAKRWQQ